MIVQLVGGCQPGQLATAVAVVQRRQVGPDERLAVVAAVAGDVVELNGRVDAVADVEDTQAGRRLAAATGIAEGVAEHAILIDAEVSAVEDQRQMLPLVVAHHVRCRGGLAVAAVITVAKANDHPAVFPDGQGWSRPGVVAEQEPVETDNHLVQLVIVVVVRRVACLWIQPEGHAEAAAIAAQVENLARCQHVVALVECEAVAGLARRDRWTGEFRVCFAARDL